MTPTDPLAADDAIVAEAGKRADAATPGPWTVGKREDGSAWLSLGNPAGTGAHYQGDIVGADADLDFIPHARSDIPALRAIADKRGRALREAMEMLAQHQLREIDGDEWCGWCIGEWPCGGGRLLARIREILGGKGE